MTLMEKYKISPTSSHQMFVSAVHRYLIWASLGPSCWRGLELLADAQGIGPLRQMTEITRKISAGDYSGRSHGLPRRGGPAAAAFNRMAEGLQRIEQLRKTMVIDVAMSCGLPDQHSRYLEAIGDGVVLPSKETFDLLEEERSAGTLGRGYFEPGQGRCGQNGPP